MLELASSGRLAATMTDMQDDYLSEPCFKSVVDSIGRARDEQNPRPSKPTGSSELGKVLQQLNGASDPLAELGCGGGIVDCNVGLDCFEVGDGRSVYRSFIGRTAARSP